MQRLILFAKRPRVGRVKTRLVPPLSPEQALELYRALLDDSARLAGGFRDTCQVELCLDGPCSSLDLPAEAAKLTRSEQGPGDLGRRLHRAFVRAAADGCSAAVAIGADAPNLPPSRIHEAFRHLAAGADPVLGPAADGGYVLIGLSAPRAELFSNVAWGGPDVAESTRRRARALGLPLVELEPWYDVDDRLSLRRLRDDLARSGTAPSPATAAHLRSLDGVYSAML